MHTPVEIQIWRLAVLFLLGAAFHALFQVYTAFRWVFRPKKSLAAAIDFFMGLITTAGFAAGIFMTSWGEIRYYVPIALGFGTLCSYLFTGKAFYLAGKRLFLTLLKIVSWAKLKFFAPIRRVIKKLEASLRTFIKPPKPTE